MLVVTISSHQLPQIDWKVEDKLSTFNFFKQRVGLYFTVAGIPKEFQVDYILFLIGKEATDRWKTLKLHKM